MSAHQSPIEADRHVGAGGASYEQVVEAYDEQFRRYLARVLDRQAEGHGGRIGVEDTLQEGLLRILQRWPDLQHLDDEERDRRLYRCLRDAAVSALRGEYGQRAPKRDRPRLIAYDFGSLEHAGDDDLPPQERELTAAVLGSMVLSVVEGQRGSEARAMLSRATLVAGLRALTEREAVVLIAVDHLGWDQHQLADRLHTDFEALRKMLFLARRIFYTLVRHATGVEVEEEERARLAAYRAGELAGAERRAVARHVKHCAACQALDAERRILGQNAVHVLGGLPFVLGSGVLARTRAPRRVLLVHGSRLFTQAGSAKAAAIVTSILGLGGGAAATLAALSDHPGPTPASSHTTSATRRPAPTPAGMERIEMRTTSSPPASRHRAKQAHHAKRTRRQAAPQTHTTAAAASPATTSTTPTPTTQAQQQQQPPRSQPSRSGQGCEFFCG